MSARTAAVIVLAIVCGSSAAVGINQLRGGATPRPAVVETVPVVVANSEILSGEVLTADHLTIRQWPKAFVHPTALTSIDDCLDRATNAPIAAGEQVLEGRFSSEESPGGLAAMIPEGLRAYTIATARDTSRVAGFVLPGNRVDILMTLRGGDQKRTGGGSTVTLLQAIEILAVAQETNAPAENKMDPQKLRSVTLLVTPDQAAMLDLGQSMGTLSLALRNPDDIAAAAPSMATVNRLRYLQTGPLNGSDGMMAPLEAELEDEPSEIRTIRGRHVGRVLVRN